MPTDTLRSKHDAGLMFIGSGGMPLRIPSWAFDQGRITAEPALGSAR